MSHGYIYPPRSRRSGKTTDLIIHAWMDIFIAKTQSNSIRCYSIVGHDLNAKHFLKDVFLRFSECEGFTPTRVNEGRIHFEGDPRFRAVVYVIPVDSLLSLRGMTLEGLYVDEYYSLSGSARSLVHAVAQQAKSYIFV